MSTGKSILSAVRQQLNLTDYRKKHWEGSFDQYLDTVLKHPEVTRSAYQRLYDMILAHGTEEVYEQKEKITRFKFFTEFASMHGDAIYVLEYPNANGATHADWVPRVRKVGRDRKATTLAGFPKKDQ